MPLLLAPFIAALIGLAFGLAGRDEIRRTTAAPSRTRGFALVVLVSALLFAPLLGYFAAFHTDWAYGYLVDGARVPSAVSLVLVATLAVIPAASYLWIANAQRAHASRIVLRALGGSIACVALAIGLLAPRIMVDTTTSGYRDNIETRPIGGTALGFAVLWMNGCLCAGIAWAAYRLRRLEE